MWTAKALLSVIMCYSVLLCKRQALQNWAAQLNRAVQTNYPLAQRTPRCKPVLTIETRPICTKLHKPVGKRSMSRTTHLN